MVNLRKVSQCSVQQERDDFDKTQLAKYLLEITSEDRSNKDRQDWLAAWEQVELITISISNAEICCMFGRDKIVFGRDKQSEIEGSAVAYKIESLGTNSIWKIGIQYMQ